jgi:transposase
LVCALQRGACAYGYVEDYWTLERITDLIWQLFQVCYHPSSVWHILQRLNWSCQKPQRRSLARQDDVIAHWKRYVWPHIKKVAPPRRTPRFPR